MNREGAPAHLDADVGASVSATDPAAEIVRLAAKLMRLQSRLKGADPGAESASGTSATLEGSPKQSARKAAVRSGIEVLQGFAVSLVDEIHDAIERDAFHYYYQPIVSVTTGTVEAYEALIRWRRGQETVAPALFLPIAEETRSIARIQQHLLDDVAAAYARLAEPISIGINWSPAQLSDVLAISAFIERVRELNIDPRRIVVEITERTAMADLDLAHSCILRLKQTGFQIALDDFGSGYCSFSYMSRLPIDLIKISGSLIGELGQSARAEVILDGIVTIAHKLGNRVVAEGVETPQQLAALRQAGCDFAQGYLIGPPAREPVAGPALASTATRV